MKRTAMPDEPQWWLMYIRYQSGKLGVVRATDPSEVSRVYGVVVLACVLAPRLSVTRLDAWPSRG